MKRTTSAINKVHNVQRLATRNNLLLAGIRHTTAIIVHYGI